MYKRQGQIDQYLTPDAINMRVAAPGGFVQSPLKALKGMKAHATEP